MDKYTSLEQAMNDPSIFIITDNISTERELNKAYIKYKKLSRKQKRYCNYYSNKFLGHDVTEMYVLLKDKMKTGDIDDKKWHLPSEKYTVTEPDLYYKEKTFNAGHTNVCFILGHSGSGKSMMARSLEGDDIDHIELDDLLLIKDHFTMEDLEVYSDLLSSFFKGEGAKYYIGIEERESIPKEEYEDKVFIDFVRFATDYSNKHKKKKYIIEGIWIYLYFEDPSEFEDYAVFIKGTSFLKSKIRVVKRERKRDKEEAQERKQMFRREARNYFLDEDKIDNYRDFYSKKPETIFRVESNKETKMAEYVVKELNKIDECFVNEDADGIRKILKQSEVNPELSIPIKMKLYNECKAALLDLGKLI